VINTEQLREFQAEFEQTRLDDQSIYKELEELRRKFEKLFPRNKILQLKPDDYVQGKRNEEPTSYFATLTVVENDIE
jgi:hypothetical protein